MFKHFFSRNWFRWTAVKYLQAHIERAITPPKIRAISVHSCSASYPIPAPKPHISPSRPIVYSSPTKTPQIKRAARLASVYQANGIAYGRPAAVKTNGGLRGSTATRWKR